MRLSHSDYRPGKRPRFVPSGPPRRKIPVIRIALLLALAVLIYTQFEKFWPRVREVASPTALWRKTFGSPEKVAALPGAWSPDSSRFALQCPRGLDAACCMAADAASPELCGETRALLAKGRWKNALAGRATALRLEARSAVSELGDWSLELAALSGRDEGGAFAFRRGAGGKSWCDTRRGCLGDPPPRAPLAQGSLRADPATGEAVWTSGAPQVRAVLAGRVMSVDSARGGARIRVYHGREIYASYGPLRPVAGVKRGVRVRSGSHLGFAPPGVDGYAVTVQVRQGGRPADPESFWRTRALEADPEPAEVSQEDASGEQSR